MRKIAIGFVLSPLFFCGCATPVAVKQAMNDKDDAYAKNIALVNQYQSLVEQSNERVKLWYVYIQSRATLSSAIKWITTNPKPPGNITPERDVEANRAAMFSAELIEQINKLRLKGLPARSDSAGHEVFVAGDKQNLDDLIQAAPALARLSREFAIQSFQAIVASDPSRDASSPYAQYIANVNVLRQLNAAEKAYLDIDVTVKSDDVKSIADEIKALAKSK